MCFYAVALPFTGPKGPTPNPDIYTRALYILHQTLLLVLCIAVGSVLVKEIKSWQKMIAKPTNGMFA